MWKMQTHSTAELMRIHSLQNERVLRSGILQGSAI